MADPWDAHSENAPAAGKRHRHAIGLVILELAGMLAAPGSGTWAFAQAPATRTPTPACHGHTEPGFRYEENTFQRTQVAEERLICWRLRRGQCQCIVQVTSLLCGTVYLVRDDVFMTWCVDGHGRVQFSTSSSSTRVVGKPYCRTEARQGFEGYAVPAPENADCYSACNGATPARRWRRGLPGRRWCCARGASLCLGAHGPRTCGCDVATAANGHAAATPTTAPVAATGTALRPAAAPSRVPQPASAAEPVATALPTGAVRRTTRTAVPRVQPVAPNPELHGNRTEDVAAPGACNDGIDNDGDGMIDAADPDCVPIPAPAASQLGLALMVAALIMVAAGSFRLASLSRPQPARATSRRKAGNRNPRPRGSAPAVPRAADGSPRYKPRHRSLSRPGGVRPKG